MKEELRVILIASATFLAVAGVGYFAYKSGEGMGYAAGFNAGRAKCPAATAQTTTVETPWNIYYLRGSTVTDEGGSLAYGVTFPTVGEARRFISTLQDLQQDYKVNE